MTLETMLTSLRQTREKFQADKADKIRAPKQLHRAIVGEDFTTDDLRVVVSIFLTKETMKKCVFKFDKEIVLADASFVQKRWRTPTMQVLRWDVAQNCVYMGKTKLRKWDSAAEYYKLKNGGVKVWCFVKDNDEAKLLKAAHYWSNNMMRKDSFTQ